MVTDGLLHSLIRDFEAARKPEKAAGMKSYMKGHFEYLGIQKPERTALQKSFITSAKNLEWEALKQLVNELWESPYREYQYVAMDVLLAVKRKWGTDAFDFFLRLIRTKSWWDTVDLLAARMVGAVVLADPSAYRKRLLDLAGDEDIWLNRTALIHQLFYKEKTDEAMFEAVVMKCHRKKDFFIQKAIGWALRQYSAVNPEFVRAFVRKHSLDGLAKKEALRKIE